MNIPNRSHSSSPAVVRVVLLALAAAFCLPLAAQTYYKWVDDQGTVHYSAEPPDDRAYDEVDTQGQVIASRELAPPAPAEPAPAERVEMPREAPPDPQLVAARCRQAQENLFWLQNKRRVILEKDDGSQEFLDEEQQQRMIEENRAMMEQWCKDVDLDAIPMNGPAGGNG